MNERLSALGQRPLFSVDDVTYTWADVLTAASADGSLQQLRSVSRQGLACLRRSEALGDAPAAETVRSAATNFRYDRGLLSAEELDAWLERWGLTVDEWTGYVTRSILLEEWADHQDELEAAFPLDDALVDEAEYADAVCSGLLEREARGFAADAALVSAAAGEAAGEHVLTVEEIRAAAAVARAGVASAPDVDREIKKQGLDWTRVEVDVLELDDQEAAREAALCIRVDGRPMADVAEDCGQPVRHMSVYLADVEPGLRSSLLAAQPGELVGPAENGDAFVLLAIHERMPPAETNPELRQRAETALVERAVGRAMDVRLNWHEPV